MKNLVYFFVFFLHISSFSASEIDIDNEYIIKLSKKLSLLTIKKGNSDVISGAEVLNHDLNIYLLKFNKTLKEDKIIQFINHIPNLIHYYKNTKLNTRSCPPDDPSYFQQWNSKFMGFEDVWCYDLKGVSPLGDTIVLGVIDNGCNCDNPDINPNLFVNRKEIPDNDLDDDNNDYVDDYRGFNAAIGKGDKHFVENHGTNVLSIAGAVGNNNNFISGAAPHIKMLMCTATDVSDLIKCYSYFIKMKKDYLSFNGKSGAYINVATLSQGLDNAMPDDYPDWCSMYDLCGEQGILCFGATTNNNEFIDEVGDLPGLCPSNYLVIVTNTDRSDTRAYSGYSKINVDIAASGELVPVIDLNNNVQLSSGTSLSTPQVAAGAAFLNQFCEKYNAVCKSNPVQSVLEMKNIILQGGKSKPELANEISSGKRFDVMGSFNLLLEYCGVISAKNDIIISSFNTHGILQYDLKLRQFGVYSVDIVNLLGKRVFSQSFNYNGQPILDQKIEVYGLQSGQYLVVLRVEDEAIAKKFILIN
ncbi:MAG: S8 family peptidase [Saprospiraceae bacterium]|nr:S8 family peptidase [Saprospiraceae bacterium]